MFTGRTIGLRSIQYAVLALLLAIPLAVAAQDTTATLVGTVTDPGGSIVPGAQVTARNIDTGLTRTVTSNDEGNYRIEFLPLGKYTVEVSYTGFKKALLGDVVLQVNDTVRADVALSVGQLSETVTISEMATPAVNTTTTEISRTIQSAEIASLPLVERNVYVLLDLTPGVQSNNNGVAAASTGTSSLILGYPEQRTLINGGVDGGTGSVNYYLDGGNNMTALRNTGNILPNPDAIQEFKVQTNAYNAEYGRFASGVINVVTKSGTNQFHGAAFEYLKNKVLNANDWGSTLPRAPYQRNQFGGTIGGPIKKDKAFFFFSYSGLRQRTSTFLSGAVVPTALERIGNFTQSGTKPTDPATGAAFVCNGVTNVICPNRLDSAAIKIINNYIPLSNVAGSKWQGNVPSPYDSDDYLGKVDYQLSDAHRLTFSYFETSGTNTVKAGTGNLPWASQQFNWRQHNVNASDVWLISPTKVNQLWATYTRNFGGRLNLPATSLGDLGSAFTIQGTPSLPQITVSGFFTLTNSIGGPTAGTNFYSVRDTLTWTKGNHAFKFGGEISLDKDIQQTLLNNYGVFTFNNGATKNALADFEIGIPSAITQDAPVTGYTNTWYTALFVNDDFRVHPRVTLNLGLRWDVQTPPTDPLNRVVNYVPGLKSTVNPIAPAGPQFFGDPGVERGGIPVSYAHWSPRLGVAWDVKGDGKTSIRAAIGQFYGSLSGNEWNTMTNFQPFSTRLTFSNINQKTNSAGVPLGATLSNPYNAFVGGNPFPYKGTFVTGGTTFAVAPDFRWPRTYQMNAGIQRALTRNITIGGAYVVTLSHNLPFARDVNYPIMTSTATTAGANVLARRPNPAFGSVLVLDSDQTADYHGWQFTFTQRMSHHLTFNGFYTYSHTNDSVQLQNNTTQGGAQNFTKLYVDAGRADTDQRHVFSLSFNYQPDYYHGDSGFLRHLINGWSIAPIIKARSGLPFTITNGSVDANLDGQTNDRAELIGDPHLDNPTAAMWFNTAAFVQNKAVTGQPVEGNAPRNLLDAPGYRAVDLAVSRDFRFTEQVSLRFRVEGTNIFNQVNLGTPGASVPSGTTSTTFGVITSAGSMRKLQFGLRLSF